MRIFGQSSKASFLVFSVLLSSSLLLAGHIARAQDAQTSTPTSTLKRPEAGILDNKKFEETRTLTDPKLRADDGSLSRYSLKFNASYFGPTLNDFSAKDQPNPDGSIGVYATALGGSMAGRYRFSPTQTLSVGTGVKAIYPLHGIERFDVNNPYIYYDTVSRWGRLQMRNSPGINFITVPVYRKVGEVLGLTFYNSFVYDFENSNFAVGLDSNIAYYLFDKSYEATDGRVATYEVSVSPNLKYRFSDRLNVTTSISTKFWNPRRLNDEAVLHNRTATQSLGLGYALTKEIFLNPYLYFYPDRIALDGTTVNFAAIFSVL